MYIQSNYVNTYQKLSSGKKIHTASDNPSGSAIIQNMESLKVGSNKGVINLEQSQSLLNAADGYLSSIQSHLSRMRELALYSLNGTLTDKNRQLMQIEMSELNDSIQDIIYNSEFNTKKIFNGESNDLQVVTGVNGDSMNVSIEKINIPTFDISTYLNAEKTLEQIDKSIANISEYRSDIGSQYNRIEHSVNNLRNFHFQTANSQSMIRDLDLSKSLINLNKEYVLRKIQYITQYQSSQFKGQIIDLLS